VTNYEEKKTKLYAKITNLDYKKNWPQTSKLEPAYSRGRISSVYEVNIKPNFIFIHPEKLKRNR